MKEGSEGRNKRIDVTMGAEVRVMPLLEGAMSQGMWEALEAGEGKDQIFPLSLQKEHSPTNTWILDR